MRLFGKLISGFMVLNLVFLMTGFVSVESSDTLTPKIKLSDHIMNQGATGYVHVSIEDAVDIGAISFDIYYDNNEFQISSWYTDNSLVNANVSYNNAENEGHISISMTFLDGFNYSGNIITLYFQSHSTTTLGNHYLDLSVGDVYDINLNPVTVESVDSTITVNELQTSIPHINMYAGSDKNNLNTGDTFTYDVYTYNLSGLSAGNFEVQYDETIFKLNSILIDDQFGHQDAVTSIYTETEGYINISYASLIDLYGYYKLFKIEFEVIQNTNEISTISLKSSNLYNGELNPLEANNRDLILSVHEVEIIEKNEFVFIDNYLGDPRDTFYMYVEVTEESRIAAGDFEIKYDSSVIEVTNVESVINNNDNGGYLFINPEYTTGSIKFSYINENGLQATENLIKITAKAVNSNIDCSTTITVESSGVVDEYFNNINLDNTTTKVQLTKLKTVKYLNEQNNIIHEEVVPYDESINPEAEYKEGYILKEWQLISEIDDVFTYIPVYELNQEYFIFNNVSKVFDGEEYTHQLLATLDGVTYIYSNNVRKDAGSQTAQVDVYLNNEFQFSKTATLSILPKTIYVTVTDQTITYGETIQSTYTVSGLIQNEEAFVTLHSETGETAGEHVLSASTNNDNYQVSVTKGTLTVLKGTYDMTNITFNDVTYTYDGNLKEIEVSGTLPSGVTVSYLNNQNTDSGSYTVTAMFEGDSSNYEAIPNQTATLTILNSSFEGITFQGETYLYDNESKSIEVTEIPEGASVTYQNNNQTLPGTYTVTATISKDNYDDFVITADLIIEKAPLVITADDISTTYGEEKQLSYTIVGDIYNEEVDISISREDGNDVGTYIITVNAVNSNYDITLLNGVYTINKAPLTITAESKEVMYGNETPLTYTIEGIVNNDIIEVILDREQGTSIGEYEISITTSNSNYNIHLVPGIYKIIGEDVDMSNVTFESVSYDYDGNIKELLITGELPTGIQSVEYINNTLTNAGTSNAVVKFTVDEGYNPVENMIAEINVNKVDITGIEVQNNVFTYDEKTKQIIFNTLLTQYGDEVTLKGNTEEYINAGTYSLEFTLSHPNYNDQTFNVDLVIHKAERIINIDDFTIDKDSISIIVNHEELKDLIYLSVNESGYTNTNKITDLEENTEYEILIYMEETDNYHISNVITIDVKTHLSKETFLNNLNSDVVNLGLRQRIEQAQIEKGNLSNSDLQTVNFTIVKAIEDYNNYVSLINTEFEITQSVNSKLNLVSNTIYELVLLHNNLLDWRVKEDE